MFFYLSPAQTVILFVFLTLLVGLLFELNNGRQLLPFPRATSIAIWTVAVLNALAIAMAVEERFGHGYSFIGTMVLLVTCVIQYRLRLLWQRVLTATP